MDEKRFVSCGLLPRIFIIYEYDFSALVLDIQQHCLNVIDLNLIHFNKALASGIFPVKRASPPPILEVTNLAIKQQPGTF